MIIINSKLVRILTFGSANGITIWPFIILDHEPSDDDINHEKIHIAQQIELLIIGFYIWYFIEWIFKGYYQISFEKEAYKNESNLNYLAGRKNFDFIKYV